MRHAVVVAPRSFALPEQGTLFTTPEPIGPLCAALAQGGHSLVVVPTTLELEADFDRALGGMGATDDLLIYIAAETTTRTDAITLRLDEDLTCLAMRVLSDIVRVREPFAVLFMVEACHDGIGDDPLLAAEHVDAIARALDAKARGYGALVGVRQAAHASRGSWPFTRHVLQALHDPGARDDMGSATVLRLVERLRALPPEPTQVQSFSFVPGRGDFIVAGPLPPPRPAKSAAPSQSSRPPPRHSSKPPSLPPLQPLIDLATGAYTRGVWEEALAGYKAALMIAPDDDASARANIYSRIADVKRAQGKLREAELNYEKALSVDSDHMPSLDALVELAVQAKEPRRTIQWRRRRLSSLERPDEISAELVVIARAYSQELGDVRAAAETLEEAHAIAPGRRDVVDHLRTAYEQLHRWPRVVELFAEAGGLTEDPIERAALRFAAADIALGRLRDEGRGLDLLERALADDPRHDQALHALVAVRTARGEWAALDALYARLVDRFAKLDDAARAWDACRKLGVLRRDKTHDVRGAIEAFTGAVSCKPSDVESRAMLADMYLAVGDEAQAVATFERIAQIAPTRASSYSRLFALHQRAGRVDRAWLAAMALEELGAADVDPQLVTDQFRSASPIRPSRSLDDDAWAELRVPGDDDVSAILLLVVDTAWAGRIEQLREDKKLVQLDPTRRQGENSTVSAVRSVTWAAQVLGLPVPAMYVMDRVPGGIAAVPSAEPSTALGPDVLRGLGTKDLAFIAGRYMAYHRPEYRALLHYPTLGEISVLFLSALKLTMPAAPVPASMTEAVARTRSYLHHHLRDATKAELQAAIERLDSRDGQVDLVGWMRGSELTAARAGFLLCGDLRTAMTRLRIEARTAADNDIEHKRADLLAFCASERLAKLRAALGADIRVGAQEATPNVG